MTEWSGARPEADSKDQQNLGKLADIALIEWRSPMTKPQHNKAVTVPEPGKVEALPLFDTRKMFGLRRFCG